MRKEVSYNGKQFYFNTPDEVTLKRCFDEVFVHQEYAVEFINSNPIVFDCGAHIGLSSIYFAKKYPRAHITAFEPNPSAIVFFRQNLAEYSIENLIAFHQVALGKSKNIVSFYPGKSPGSMLASSHFQYDGPKVPVATVKLSEFVEKHTIVDFIKIDVEGSEWGVMEELDLSGQMHRIEQFIIEYHQPHKSVDRISEFIEILTKNGYHHNIRLTKSVPMFRCHLIHFYRPQHGTS